MDRDGMWWPAKYFWEQPIIIIDDPRADSEPQPLMAFSILGIKLTFGMVASAVHVRLVAKSRSVLQFFVSYQFQYILEMLYHGEQEIRIVGWHL